MHIPEDEHQQEIWLAQLIEDPAHQDNPLLPVVVHLQQKQKQQNRRLEKLVRIADGFDGMTHNQNRTLLDRYEKQLRRLTKIARISDLYQKTMVELNESLRQAALHDPLTGLPNRRNLAERLKEEVARVQRSGHSFAIMMLDIDFFKRINDRYGHDSGDQVLIAAAGVIKQHLRQYDVCCRWGGEEFLMFLPETDLAQAQTIADRIREAFHHVKLAVLDDARSSESSSLLTVSIGLTIYRQDEPYEATINRSDAALYDAKERGRDLVIGTA